MRFSERKGITPVRVEIQIDDLDEKTRNKLWNVQLEYYWRFIENSSTYTKHSRYKFEVQRLWNDHFGWPIDTIPGYTYQVTAFIRDKWKTFKFHECLDLIEFLSQKESLNQHLITMIANDVFERELVGYRIIDGMLTDVTLPQEIESIEVSTKLDGKFSSCAAHLSNALRLYSDRENPKYRNSVAESMSAVESACKVIAGNDKATLGKALDVLERNAALHPALKETFDKLYGYASQVARHGQTTSVEVYHAEAKFILVASSAFVNYLKEKYTIA